MTKVSSFSSKFYKVSSFPSEFYGSPFTICDFEGQITIFLENIPQNIQTFVSINGGEYSLCNTQITLEGTSQLVFKFIVDSLPEDVNLPLLNITGQHEICSFNFRNT